MDIMKPQFTPLQPAFHRATAPPVPQAIFQDAAAITGYWTTESPQTASRPGQAPPSKAFADLLNRYLQSDVPSKRSAVAGTNRILRILRDEPLLVQQPLTVLNTEHFAAWRNRGVIGE
ncbi:MAG: hypothetical protein ACYDDP_02675 [Acidithiobacillus sp.]